MLVRQRNGPVLSHSTIKCIGASRVHDGARVGGRRQVAWVGLRRRVEPRYRYRHTVKPYACRQVHRIRVEVSMLTCCAELLYAEITGRSAAGPSPAFSCRVSARNVARRGRVHT